jgi:hypothetical protein
MHNGFRLCQPFNDRFSPNFQGRRHERVYDFVCPTVANVGFWLSRVSPCGSSSPLAAHRRSGDVDSAFHAWNIKKITVGNGRCHSVSEPEILSNGIYRQLIIVSFAPLLRQLGTST